MKRVTVLLAILVAIAWVSCKKPMEDLVKPQETATPKPTKDSLSTQNPNLTCGNTLNTAFAKRIDSLEVIYNKGFSPFANLPGDNNLTGAKYALLDFNGQIVNGTPWNNNGPIVCTSVTQQLTASQRTALVTMVANNVSKWNIIIGTNEYQYNSTSCTDRTRAIVCRNMNNIFPPAAGYAVVGSMSSGLPEFPCFVMADNLGYDIYNLAWNITHEILHTFGINHRSLWVNGQLTYVYYPVVGSGSWDATGDIMGTCYSSNYTVLGNGTDEFGNPHRPIEYLDGVAGTVPDDVDTLSTSLNTTHKKVLNGPTDVDVYKISKKTAKASVIAYNVDIRIRVLNAAKQQIALWDDATDVGIALKSITAQTGNTLYFVVEKSQNQTNLPSETAYGRYDISFK